MGTSVRMIEKHYGALLDGAHNVIANRLDAFEAEMEKCSKPAASFASAREAGDGVPNQLRADEQKEHGHDHRVVTGHPAS
jgi:hypothetical protein